MNLTPRQQSIYQYITQYTHNHHRAPTLQEISQAVGPKSLSAVHRHLNIIEAAGLLNRTTGKRNLNLTPTNSPLDSPIPLLGTYLANSTLKPSDKYLSISSPIITQHLPVFAIQIGDTSFLNAHIAPDDLLIFQKTNTYESGDIILAQLENSIPLIRRARPYQRFIHLYNLGESETPTIVRADKLQVLGRLLQIIRTILPS